MYCPFFESHKIVGMSQILGGITTNHFPPESAWVGFNFVLVAWKSLQLLERKEEDKKISIQGVRKKMSKITTRDHLSPDLPFTLILLADLIVENAFRFRILNQKVMTYLSNLAVGSDVKAIRLFSFDIMMHLITSQGLGSSKDIQTSPTPPLSGHNSIG